MLQNTRFLLMAGGKGTRLWPKSRSYKPKQFIEIFGEQSLLQVTYNRIQNITSKEHIFVATFQEFADLAKSQLSQLPPSNLLLEPVLKDTAACIALAIPFLCRDHSDPVIVTLPVDTYVGQEDAFQQCLAIAVEEAHRTASVVTIGIRPTRPETGFGYMCIEEHSHGDVYKVKKFIEKPNLEKAQQYYKNTAYYWNSGIYVTRSSTLKRLFKDNLPQHHEALSLLERSIGTKKETAIIEQVYNGLESISIDYGLMEKATDIYMVPAAFDWDDLGTWGSLGRLCRNTDETSNIISGKCVVVDSKNCIVDTSSKFVALLGVEDLIIVDTDDVIFVCDRKREQDIKKLYQTLREQGNKAIL